MLLFCKPEQSVKFDLVRAVLLLVALSKTLRCSQ